MRFRSKPKVVDAWQWTDDSVEWPAWVRANVVFVSGRLQIRTLEGVIDRQHRRLDYTRDQRRTLPLQARHFRRKLRGNRTMTLREKIIKWPAIADRLREMYPDHKWPPRFSRKVGWSLAAIAGIGVWAALVLLGDAIEAMLR